MAFLPGSRNVRALPPQVCSAVSWSLLELGLAPGPGGCRGLREGDVRFVAALHGVSKAYTSRAARRLLGRGVRG